MRLHTAFPLAAASLLWPVVSAARVADAQRAEPQSGPPSLQAPAPVPSPNLSFEEQGDLYMARKMYREAIEVYGKIVGGSKNAVIVNKIGIAYHNLLEFNTARKYYRNALKLNPKYAEARNNLGAVAYARRDFKGAIREYERALKLKPGSATVYSNLGTAYFARKKYEQAAKAYRQALMLDPGIFDAHSGSGTILQERSVAERAKYHYYIAKAYAEVGMTDRALLNIRKSLEEGFKDKKKYLEEPAFLGLQGLAEFKELMSMEFRVL